MWYIFPLCYGIDMAPPRKKNPRTEFVTLRLTTTEANDLDSLAAHQGLSRSQAVRAAVARVIAAEQRKSRGPRIPSGPKVV